MDKKKIAGLVIAAIMVLSILGVVVDFGTQPSAQKMPYGDFKFTPTQQGYTKKIDGKDFAFFYFPANLEYYAVPDNVKNLLEAPVYTVTYDPRSNLTQNFAEVQYYLEFQLEEIRFIEQGITSGNDTLPQKTCADATAAQPVILLQQGDESKITAQESCIILQAVDGYDLYREAERIVYQILGVMK